MAIVHRNGRPYLYRSVRRGGRVTSQYLGSGEAAALLGRLDADRRVEGRAERDAWEAERGRLDAEERAAAEAFDLVQSFAAAALVAAGYHQHRRQWRKRRVRNQDPAGSGRKGDGGRPGAVVEGRGGG